MAPRHPPNALITLDHQRQRPHAGPNRPTCKANQRCTTMPSSLVNSTSNQPIHLSKNVPTQTAPSQHQSMRRVYWKRRHPTGIKPGRIKAHEIPSRHRRLSRQCRDCCLTAAPASSSLRGIYSAPKAQNKWRRSGSNRRPPACKAGALPAELRPQTIRGPKRQERP